MLPRNIPKPTITISMLGEVKTVNHDFAFQQFLLWAEALSYFHCTRMNSIGSVEEKGREFVPGWQVMTSP